MRFEKIKNEKKIKNYLKKFALEYNDIDEYYGVLNIYKDNLYIVVKDKNKEIGFLRIEKSYGLMESFFPDSKMLNVIYVNPEFRHMGISEKIIKMSSDYCNVQYICLELNVFLENYSYYKRLGFTNYLESPDEEGFGFAIRREVAEIIQRMKKDLSSHDITA